MELGNLISTNLTGFVRTYFNILSASEGMFVLRSRSPENNNNRKLIKEEYKKDEEKRYIQEEMVTKKRENQTDVTTKKTRINIKLKIQENKHKKERK